VAGRRPGSSRAEELAPERRNACYGLNPNVRPQLKTDIASSLPASRSGGGKALSSDRFLPARADPSPVLRRSSPRPQTPWPATRLAVASLNRPGRPGAVASNGIHQRGEQRPDLEPQDSPCVGKYAALNGRARALLSAVRREVAHIE
jgi:hypothetical protein